MKKNFGFQAIQWRQKGHVPTLMLVALLCGFPRVSRALDIGQCFPTPQTFSQALANEGQCNLVMGNEFADSLMDGTHVRPHAEARFFTSNAAGEGYIAGANFAIGEVPENLRVPAPTEQKTCIYATTRNVRLFDPTQRVMDEATHIASNIPVVRQQCALEKAKDEETLCGPHDLIIRNALNGGQSVYIQGDIIQDGRVSGLRIGARFTLLGDYNGKTIGTLSHTFQQGTLVLFQPYLNVSLMPSGAAVLMEQRLQ
jgi:hypothetical protein